jgi:hypothetical protein
MRLGLFSFYEMHNVYLHCMLVQKYNSSIVYVKNASLRQKYVLMIALSEEIPLFSFIITA